MASASAIETIVVATQPHSRAQADKSKRIRCYSGIRGPTAVINAMLHTRASAQGKIDNGELFQPLLCDRVFPVEDAGAMPGGRNG